MIIRRVTLAEDFIRTNNLLLSNTADTDLADIIALVSRQKVLRIQLMIKNADLDRNARKNWIQVWPWFLRKNV